MIRLRPLTTGDVPTLLRIYSGPSLTFTRGRAMTVEEAAAYVDSAAAQARETPPVRWCYGITHEADLIGVIKAHDRGERHATLSYILRPETWGHGYATEAVRQMTAHLFTATHLERLTAQHHPDNPASGRVLAKSGFTYTGITPSRRTKKGPTTLHPVYELRRREP